MIDKSETPGKPNRHIKISFGDKTAAYEKFDIDSFDKESIKFSKPTYVAFCVLESSKMFINEWYYDKMQPYFGHDNLELH